MIPENRETEERSSSDGGVYNVEQKLQAYLRDKYTPEALSSPMAKEQHINLLAQVAKDWCLKHNDYKTDQEYRQLAIDAMKNYLSNWTGKKQGTDNRSHNLGRMLLGNIL